MKSFYMILLSILVYTNTSYSQNILSKISRSVGLISFNDNTNPGYGFSGTGTLIIKPKHDSAKICLVTNKHVLPTFQQSQNIDFRIKDDSSSLGYTDEVFRIFDDKGNYVPNLKMDPDGNDLAILDITGFFVRHPEKSYLLTNALSSYYLANSDTLEKNDIDMGDEIAFIGYPNTLYDKRNVSPIIRTGLIATSPKNDFYFSNEYRSGFLQKFNVMIPQKISGFLIDANATGGSSGSLVISKPRYMRVAKDGTLEYINNPDGLIFILGILTESYFDVDSRLSGMQHLNLGGVISASQIIKTINLFNY